jgi:hypothetical protein
VLCIRGYFQETGDCGPQARPVPPLGVAVRRRWASDSLSSIFSLTFNHGPSACAIQEPQLRRCSIIIPGSHEHERSGSGAVDPGIVEELPPHSIIDHACLFQWGAHWFRLKSMAGTAGDQTGKVGLHPRHAFPTRFQRFISALPLIGDALYGFLVARLGYSRVR